MFVKAFFHLEIGKILVLLSADTTGMGRSRWRAGSYSSLISDVRWGDVCGLWRYAGCMRYAQGGGLTAEGRRRRELVRLEAGRRFEQGAPAAVIAAELRVSERSVRRWRQAWQAEVCLT